MFRHLLNIAACVLLSAAPAMAHPGHGAVQYPQGLMHYVTSPMHVGSVLLAVVVLLPAAVQLGRLRVGRLRVGRLRVGPRREGRKPVDRVERSRRSDRS